MLSSVTVVVVISVVTDVLIVCQQGNVTLEGNSICLFVTITVSCYRYVQSEAIQQTKLLNKRKKDI